MPAGTHSTRPTEEQRSAAREIHARGNQHDGKPICCARPFAEQRDGNERREPEPSEPVAASPRRARTGTSRTPARPYRSSATSHGSKLVVTAKRVIALQLAQIAATAKP